jgi:hypothetical protein
VGDVEQGGGLTVAVDELFDRDGLAVAERVQALNYRAIWLYFIEPCVRLQR